VAHVEVVELVIMRKFGPEGKRLCGLGLAVEGIAVAPSRGIAGVRAVDVSLGAGEDKTAAYDGAEARLAFRAALPGFGGHGTFGPQDSPCFWHSLHFWFDEFLSSGSHCCGLDSKSERTREKQCGLKQNGALEAHLP
jgi:hypothetical protein